MLYKRAILATVLYGNDFLSMAKPGLDGVDGL